MKIKIQTLLIFFFLFMIINPINFGQSNIKKGFKFGMELGNILSTNTGSFSKSFDYTLGIFTGINIYSYSKEAIILRLEANYIRLQYFNPGRKINYIVNTFDENWNGFDYAVFDEKYWFNIIELGLIPEYHLQLNEKISMELFLGPSFGIGNKGVEVKQLDNNPLNGDPHDEYGMDFISTISMNLGVSFYYSPIMIGIRYRYINLNKYSSLKTNFHNVYTQIGIAF